jgi:hypothetical protein
VKVNIWENFRLYKGNIFPSRKSVVSDIPAGEGKTAKSFFTVYFEITGYGVAKSECCIAKQLVRQAALRQPQVRFLIPRCMSQILYTVPSSGWIACRITTRGRIILVL